MEDWLFYTLTTLLCLLCSLLLRARAPGSKARHADSSSAIPPLPPGPTPLPVLGPLLFLARRDFDIEPVLRRIARDYGKVFTFSARWAARARASSWPIRAMAQRSSASCSAGAARSPRACPPQTPAPCSHQRRPQRRLLSPRRHVARAA
ncbi:unnamed protein product [Miscanthus lutarioriparius]|uniref:Cytochrome P450 n=1 Tax=Miscanthus lutarioriparius TaxID=422564 RepID=A0A811NN64_9POAL|nr:unnamed protein product [Miscanthus lutarioriparius]